MPSTRASTSRLAAGSRLAVGSSRKSTSGCRAQARASARRCCWPAESVCAGRSASASRPTRCSALRARAARPARGTPCSHSATSRLRRTESRRKKGRWKTMAPTTPPRAAWGRCTRRCAAACGGTTPCSSRSSVVLPAPLEPTSTRRSPRCSVRLTPSRAGIAPSRTPATHRLTSGAPATASGVTAVSGRSGALTPARPPAAPAAPAAAPAARAAHPPRPAARAPAPAPAAGRPCSSRARSPSS